MKMLENFKLAAFIGALVGLFFGVVDILARIIAMSFEWFEFYQALLIPMMIFTIGFIFLSLLIEVFGRVIKVNISKQTLSLIYFVSATSIFLLFYSEIFIIKIFLFPYANFFDPSVLKVSLAIACIIGLIYILLLTKGRRQILSFLSFAVERGLKKFAKNLLFIAGVFIIISFVMDLYILSYPPTPILNEELEGYPNIILIVSDSLRADHLSTYGYELETSPNIDKLAKESIVFESAISSAPWTIPSISSIFTGKNPSNHNSTTRHMVLDADELTLAEILRKKGYNTAGFSGDSFIKAKYGMGQGFITYRDRLDFFEYITTYKKFDIRYLLSFLPIYRLIGADGELTAEELNSDIFRWLDNNKQEPFFMFIMYNDPHDPYNLGEEFRGQFTNETRDYRIIPKTQSIKRGEHAPKEIVDYMIALYDTEIFYLDHHIGKLLNKLEEIDLKSNTIIVITADHGEEFYDHGDFGHWGTLYEEAIHVPLIIYYPKEFEARRVEKRVGTVNIFPTVLDTLGIELPDEIDSISLLPLIENRTGYDREYALSEFTGRPYWNESTQRTISYKNWKLIEVAIPRKELVDSALFNLEEDPKELNNLYDINIKERELLQEYLSNLTTWPEEL